jgi:sugar/nucleoside kinase (ribokinase family)
MSGKLLQLSGVVIDLVHPVHHVPVAGEEVEAMNVTVTAGGGFNAMVAARRFGAEVSYGGAIGTGMFATIAERMIGEAGLTILTGRRQDIDQGTCVVLVDADGERSFVSRHGAERRLDADDLRRIAATGHDWILLSGYSLLKEESARVLLPWIAGLPRGPRFLFDPGPIVADTPQAALDAVLDRADWVSANRREAAILTGLDDPAAAASKLAANRQGAIVRIGADGCWLAMPGEASRHIAGFAVEAIDTNGAGDTHDGAFIAACCRGFSFAESAVLANAAAALATTRPGPATAPGFDETWDFLESQGRCPAPPGTWQLKNTVSGRNGR